MSISKPTFGVSLDGSGRACCLFRVGLSAFLLLLLVSFGSAAFAQDDPSLPEKAELMTILKARLSGEIRVGGVVLDAATGKPLGGVRLSVTTGIFDFSRPELHTETRHREEVTGAFRYQCNLCTDVRLHLGKGGYRSEILTFAVAAVEGNVVDETSLRIALRPLENPVMLQMIQGELKAGSDVAAKVLALDFSNRKARVVGLDRLPAKAAGGTDAFVLRLSVDTGADGKALVAGIAEGKAKRAPVVPIHPRPVGAALEFSSIGAVVRHDPEEAGPPAALRSMLEAPAEGYGERLELGSVTKPVFFYCRVGQRYGKGYVEAPWLDHDGAVRAHVRLWLNDGSGRSVEAAYD